MSIQAPANLNPIKVPNQNLALNLPANTKFFEKNNTQTNIKPMKLDLLKKFETSVKNKCDMGDTVQVPRTIFKGYLSFMMGTALASIGAFVKNKKARAAFAIPATLLTMFGTWSFVRPYVIKDSQKKD